jgi:hypothetical protein
VIVIAFAGNGGRVRELVRSERVAGDDGRRSLVFLVREERGRGACRERGDQRERDQLRQCMTDRPRVLVDVDRLLLDA